MKKLKLNVDTLRIESFETSRSGARAGTVRGLQDTVSDPVGATAFCANTAYCSLYSPYTSDYDGDTIPDSTNGFPNTTTNVH